MTDRQHQKLAPEILDRLLPQDIGAERNVLGSIMLDPSVLDDIGSRLHPEHFYQDSHQKLYGHLLALRDESRAIDTTLLVAHLKQAGDLEAIGGTTYLAELLQGVAVASHAAHYATIIREKAALRDLIHTAAEILRDAYDPAASSAEVLASAEEKLTRIETGEYRGEPTPIATSVLEAMERIEQVVERTRQVGLLSGIEELDRSLGGLFPGELFILGARPEVGKTALACQIAEHVASRKNLVYFASLEMSDIELTTRMLCSTSGVNSMRIRTATIDQQGLAELVVPANELAQADMVIHSRPGLSVSDIRRACRRLVPKDLSLVVVDYLQRITPTDHRVSRNEEVGKMAEGLKTLARELNVPVLCLSQLNREADKAGKPTLGHLRESGDIEAEGDVVAFLLRPVQWYENDDPTGEKAALDVLKNRNGAKATFRLRWDAPRTRFYPPDVTDMANYESDFSEFG